MTVPRSETLLRDPTCAGARTNTARNDRRERHALRLTLSAAGAVVALAGIEHGIGEILQGNVAPEGIIFKSWPDSEAFRILNGEPVMSIVPNMLVTGILAILVSLAFLVWVTVFIHRKNAGRVLALIAALMLLVGGGLSPPFIGIFLAGVAGRMHAPLTWWRTQLPGSGRLARLWPWFLAADLVAWLAVFPGVVLVEHFFGEGALPAALVFAVIGSALGLLLLAVGAGFAYDSERRLARARQG